MSINPPPPAGEPDGLISSTSAVRPDISPAGARPTPSPQDTPVDLDSVLRPPRWYAILWSNTKARIGIIMLAVFVLMAVLAPVLAPYSPTDGSFAPVLPLSWDHPLGTTAQGYDILSQFIYGARLSLLIGLFGGLFSTVIAVVIGLVSGYAEGTWLDSVLSFFTNLALVVPVLPLMLVIVAYSETRGLWLLVFVIGITSWAGAARAKRAQIITLRNRDFVTAATFAGEKSTRIVFREIMPNMTSLIVASFIGAATGAIVAEAGLSFLGFGDPTSISWGLMLTQANANGALVQGLWVWLFVPGIALALLVTSLTFVNFGVDLLSNPHLREA
ncbi:ABC transporter permease subunit [Nakamurella sp. YIM 132087]|uniref:ABC transporter permease subunit n=1 Tax=Nakamurella alba TaxID=2665158 RepID=A0A7K1FEZ3_9ACTN|nr:ABC transporter permease [Nakamurella alba]MTD12646.1 ABC transporter permease subunit [Nakamurella alba]